MPMLLGWLLGRLHDRRERRRTEAEPTAWATFWESVAQMLDQDDGVDEVALRRSMRNHPAGKKRQ
ncbi:MAG: hypothetical protein J2P16_08760 [Mycobacterium sp.]|nr:hypothetical protein [Mycobacterium sp.]